jgi:nucleoid-associated protein YgaU
MAALPLSRTRGLVIALGLATATCVSVHAQDSGKAQASAPATETKAAESERSQLETELAAATAELAELRAEKAKLEQGSDATKLADSVSKLEAELNDTRGVAHDLAEKNQQLEDVAAQRGRDIAQLRKDLEAAKLPQSASEGAAKLTALQADKALVEEQLAKAQDQLRKTTGLTERAERAERVAEQLRIQNEKLAADFQQLQNAHSEGGDAKAKIDQLAVDSRAQADKLSAENKALSSKLASAITDLALLTRKNQQLSDEVNQLRMTVPAGVSDPVERVDRVAALEKQVAEQTERAVAAETKLASIPATGSDDGTNVPLLKRQLADAEMKLATSLRSYSLLQQELDQAKSTSGERAAEAEAKATTAQAEVGSLRTQLETAQADLRERNSAIEAMMKEQTQIRQNAIAQGLDNTNLRDQLRQTQAQLGLVIEENAHFRTKLAVNTPPPASTMALPTRPGTQAAQAAITLPSTIAKPGVPADAKATGEKSMIQVPRQHVLVDGDNLIKLARRYYGNGDRWKEIFDANRKVLADPSRLPKGAVLVIP